VKVKVEVVSVYIHNIYNIQTLRIRDGGSGDGRRPTWFRYYVFFSFVRLYRYIGNVQHIMHNSAITVNEIKIHYLKRVRRS